MKKCDNPQHHHAKSSQLCHEHTLTKIEMICAKRNIRLTAQRKAVIQLMLKADRAMSAYDLLDQLREIEPQAKPPTIYRALDFLIEQAFIHKVESLNSYIICPNFDDLSHISILFICNQCQTIHEQHSAIIEQELQAMAKQDQFTIQHSVLEIQGTCQHCR
ncbi:zinc uptake transcriptional repressor Zur [Utexia brackfieldae]|uniref:zinc uptake transcriptional repressor Zur n=1 Tax=Utexia brackfieldae TaxID=3074108 RepID=UPI00370DBD4E